MTYRHWDTSTMCRPLSAPSQMQSTGNGGSHGDLRERVRALEERQAALQHYAYDRLKAHHDRLIIGDEKMARLSQDAVEVKRQVLANSEAIATIKSSHDETHSQVAEMRAVAASQSMASENRRAARKEVAVLALWVLVALVIIGALTGIIPRERLEALQHLKMLPGL